MHSIAFSVFRDKKKTKLFYSQKLAEDLTIHRILNVKNDNYKVQYRDGDSKNVLTIGKKEFHHIDHQIKFKESWVRLFCFVISSKTQTCA